MNVHELASNKSQFYGAYCRVYDFIDIILYKLENKKWQLVPGEDILHN